MSARLDFDAALDERIREIVRQELARKAGGVYASNGPLPPGASRRAFVEACRSGKIAGAAKEGRVWMCPREAWHRARTARPASKLKLTLVSSTTTDAQRADAMIAAAGFRLTRSST